MKKTIKMLLTCVGGRRALDIINILKNDKTYNYKIFGVDINEAPKIKKKLDKFYKVPNGDKQSFIHTILKIIKKNKIEFAIFGTDEEVINVSNNIYLFKNLSCFIPVMQKNKLNIITNKLKLFQKLNKKNISLAKWNIVKNINDLEKISKKFKRNFVLKPVESRGGRNIFIVNDDKKKIKKVCEGSEEVQINYNDLINKINIKKKLSFQPYIIMEKLFRPAYDIDVLSINGRILDLIIRKRLFLNPYKKHSFSKNLEIKKYCTKIVKSLKLSYLFDIDLMVDKNNKPKILEINPRMSGTIYITLKKLNLINSLYEVMEKSNY